MTIIESNNFYSTDLKEYELINNTKFLECYDIIKDFAHYSIEDLQKFINIIYLWYVTKYPDFYFERTYGIVSERFKYIENIDKHMDYVQLIMRISKYIPLINGISYIPGFYQIYDKRKKDKYLGIIPVTFKSNSNYVDSFTLEDLGINQKLNITIEELEEKLKQSYSDIYDFSEISKYICTKQVNIKLRDVVLNLILLKILYSKDTTPEYGYERAKKLIEEFNKEIPYLNLDSTRIDEIINSKYYFDNRIIVDDEEAFVPDEISDIKPRIKI